MIVTVLVKCTGDQVEFNSDDLPAVSNGFIFSYGIRQWVNDGAAKQRKDYDSDEAYETARREGANERIERLRAGDVPGTREPTDPNAALIRKTLRLAKEKNVDLGRVGAEELVAYLAKKFAQGRAA